MYKWVLLILCFIHDIYFHSNNLSIPIIYKITLFLTTIEQFLFFISSSPSPLSQSMSTHLLLTPQARDAHRVAVIKIVVFNMQGQHCPPYLWVFPPRFQFFFFTNLPFLSFPLPVCCNLQFFSELITSQLRISHGVTANSLNLPYIVSYMYMWVNVQ